MLPCDPGQKTPKCLSEIAYGEIADLAGKVLRLVREEMFPDLPEVEIVWARIASLTTLGFMRPAVPDTIYLSATLSEEELVRALVHEVVHVVQARTTGTTELSEWAAEGVAAVYVRRLVLEGELDPEPSP